jgi:hypothetical protein
MTIHIVWEERTQVSMWSDDVGSILLNVNHFQLDRIKVLLQTPYTTLGSDLRRITFTVLAEGLTSELLRQLTDCLPPNVDIFTICAIPGVQTRFDDVFLDDVVVFDAHEQVWQSQYQMPRETCFVLSQQHPGYKLAIYRGGGRDELLEFAKQMSHLSWLSAKPGSEARAVAYPPHVSALLAHGRGSVFAISRFEFLPTGDVI